MLPSQQAIDRLDIGLVGFEDGGDEPAVDEAAEGVVVDGEGDEKAEFHEPDERQVLEQAIEQSVKGQENAEDTPVVQHPSVILLIRRLYRLVRLIRRDHHADQEERKAARYTMHQQR